MSTWAVLPAKCLARAKSRLAPVLPPRCREALAAALVMRTIAELSAVDVIERVVVVGSCACVLARARGLGAFALRDPPGAGLAASVDTAVSLARAGGARDVVVVMADLPLLAAPDIAGLLAAARRAPAVAAPDRHGLGTNALVLRDLRLATQFGRADSLERHRWLGAVVHHCPRLALDVDRPPDLVAAGLVAEPRVARQLVVGAEHLIGVGDRVQRRAARLRHPRVERRALPWLATGALDGAA